jgi:hypothetical protein
MHGPGAGSAVQMLWINISKYQKKIMKFRCAVKFAVTIHDGFVANGRQSTAWSGRKARNGLSAMENAKSPAQWPGRFSDDRKFRR